MNIHTFHPASLAFVKNKAKQLQKAMPGMKLSTAQEATATALGFSSWFVCDKRLGGEQRQSANVFDEELDRSVFIRRRHHQYCALVETGGIPPLDAAQFVRVWALTSREPAKHLPHYSHAYSDLLTNISAAKQGLLDWEEEGFDEPTLIADGLLHGNLGTKHSYYVLNQNLYSKLPPYQQGNSCCSLDFEEGLVLPVFLSEFSPTKEDLDKGTNYLYNHEPWHYEWLTQKVCTSKSHVRKDLFSLLRLARENVDAWFPLSFRTVYPQYPSIASSREYIPAVKGNVFAEFIEAQGRVSQKNINWFALPEGSALKRIDDVVDGQMVPIDVNELHPCDPVYHSPFTIHHSPFTIHHSPFTI